MLLGIFAMLMMVVGTIGWWADHWPVFFNSMLRAGILLFGVWLAYPQLTGGRWKATAGITLLIGLLILLLASRPRLIPVVVIMLAAIFLLHSALPKLMRWITGPK
ncbi:MAG TPA: hypothetical protein PKD54_01565 [Pirellulaceae bacterium]|nr:hypothetical protein [Pirellulaceae bacterium]